jgi:hypothetical protein
MIDMKSLLDLLNKDIIILFDEDEKIACGGVIRSSA